MLHHIGIIFPCTYLTRTHQPLHKPRLERPDTPPSNPQFRSGDAGRNVSLEWAARFDNVVPAHPPPLGLDDSERMLIVVEGCIGVGKTTVSNGLASFRGSVPLLEAFEANPFLTSFYKDPIGTALETEFSFLLMHYHQLKNCAVHARTSEVISDFHLGKDLLYADLNLLQPRAQKLFHQLYELLLEELPRESLMVFLSAPIELLLQRIRQRKREYELEIDANYFARLNARYEDFYANYPGRKLPIPMAEWDFVKDPTLFQTLSSKIDGALKSP